MRSQASRQQLRNGKVTHLRVILKSIVPAGKNASAVLKDPTGRHCSMSYFVACAIAILHAIVAVWN